MGSGLFLVAAVIGAAATQGASADLPTTDIRTKSEAQVDWSNATAEFGFALPDRVTWPTNAPHVLASNDYYEAGFEDSVASFYWMCAWETSLLTSAAASDEEGFAISLDALHAFANDSGVGARMPGLDAWSKAVLDTAAMGNLEPIKADAMGLCAGFPEMGAK